jgi:hypothetical protein
VTPLWGQPKRREKMLDFNKQVEQFERDLLKNLLLQCTQEQQSFFLKLYPDGVANMPRKQIKRASEQCEATIKKNASK